MLKKILIIPMLVTFSLQIVYGLTTILPKENFHDVNIPSSQIGNNKGDVLSAIAFVNEYLRFAIGFLCFVFLVFNGFKLIIARGDKEIFKKSTMGLVGSIVGIVICLLSYSAVRMIVNLF